MSMAQIEKGVPMPQPKVPVSDDPRTRAQYPFGTMAVGDSLRFIDKSPEALKARKAMSMYATRHKSKWKSKRVLEHGIYVCRIWRME